MPRAVPVLAAVLTVGVLASRRGRGWAADTLRRRRGGLPKGTQEYPTRLVDRRGPTAETQLPPRAETPVEVVSEFYAKPGSR